MPGLFIIDEKWNPQPWFSTGGTRAKKYLQAPDGKFYYFKRSQYKDPTATKPGKDFKYEFWSEVIAYEVGTLLGFNVLRYDIAVDGDIMGCISESMIDSEKQELIELAQFLQLYNDSYPEKKKLKSAYTFQIIQFTLDNFSPGIFINPIIETIIFDSIIGNGDRHQENWAIISEFVMEESSFGTPGSLSKVYYKAPEKFAPIYDSGSSLGRELLDEKIEKMLASEAELEKYINKGLSEIHWENKKITHFELIRNLKESGYREIVTSIIQRIIQKFDGPKIEQIIQEIDSKTPLTLLHYKIPASRKTLIFKLITSRFKRLEGLLHE